MMYVYFISNASCLAPYVSPFFFESIGPIAQFHENSRYYSAVRPLPNPEVDQHLPHITVEMPVYKESLEETM
jgi:hypothetical protein